MIDRESSNGFNLALTDALKVPSILRAQHEAVSARCRGVEEIGIADVLRGVPESSASCRPGIHGPTRRHAGASVTPTAPGAEQSCD